MGLGKKKILSQGAAGAVVNTDNFQTLTYTGTCSTQSTNSLSSQSGTLNFQPDFIWFKSRVSGHMHQLYNSISGVNLCLNTGVGSIGNRTGNEPEFDTSSAYGGSGGDLRSFNSNGFTIGACVFGGVNENTFAHVAWCWYAPTAESISASGSRVASTIKKNVDAGFSIVTFTTPSSNQNFQIGHGLGVKPDMVIMKKRNDSGAWLFWHKDLSDESYHLFLNSTAGESGLTQDSRIWGQQSFTSTTISTSTGYSYDVNDTVVSYCFANIAGYQKVDKYIGNSGTNAITTGFQPRFVLMKNTANGYSWIMQDSVRGANKFLYPNLNNAEVFSGTHITSFDSNGFTLGNNADVNLSGNTYIYLAIA